MGPAEATFADVQKLIVFFLKAWEEAGPGAFGFTGATQETINEIASEEFLKERLSKRDVKMYFVEDGGNILGLAVTRKIDENAIELSGIIVLEASTRKGIGTELFEKVISSAKHDGFGKIVVKTEVLNQRAIGFYKKKGLSEVGKTRENVEGRPVDLVVLERCLR